MAITGEAYGGSMLVPGWTNQNLGQAVGTLSSNLEDGAGPGGFGAEQPSGNGYLGWSMIPEDAITSTGIAATSTYGWLTRVYAGGGGVCTHLDIIVETAASAPTNVVFALYSGASFATGPLAWTADGHTIVGTNTGVLTFTWNGTNSPSGVALGNGTVYWVYMEITATTGPKLAGSTGSSGAAMNVNLTASTTYANNSMTLTSGASTAPGATTTLVPSTSWANSATKFFVGLR